VLTPVSRMGPPPRSFAADAHGCIMVRCPYGPTGYKVAARVPRAPTASSPRTRHPDHNERAAVLGSIKARPGTMEREASTERRPALTAPARAGFQHVWVGAKKRDSTSNKETGMKEVENAVK
jgi:hypothetical protein